MTHTVHPFAHRLGILRTWKSRWISHNPAEYRKNLGTDLAIRKFLTKRLRGMYVTAVEIERSQKALRILIKTSRPGLVIGRGGEGSTKLAKEVEAVVKLQKPKEMPQVKIDIEEIRSPESQAPIVAYMIAEGLEKRQTFRRVMKQTMEKSHG
jgi:small subunit ribosomal protein S3